MSFHLDVAFVFVAGLITALATGIGAFPFFVLDEVSDRWNVFLWSFAGGIMVSASIFGLISEGLASGARSTFIPGLPVATPVAVGIGMAVGVVLVIGAHRVISGHDFNPRQYEQADFTKLVLILGILTVHSFPEGVAVGVSFADLGLQTADGFQLFGTAVPLLAVFMTVAISIHNVPEGIAISIPLKSMDVPNWHMVWWAVFSSLPQPIGAVLAFAFVRIAREFLPFGFGFAAGAMIYLVVTEFIPEALETGEDLPRRGIPELVAGIAGGVLFMLPLRFV